ncbi:kinesin heavy chain [Aulographum hederae CBS 113979]|uniref:Kinesin heavy chain n=1 Tax=Aulographum hederae CBS 113979 TaxID=1176131 RepID=A0A6G1GL81_9PEZI|nr:kinesin heavy chain [Aulographum hederae CBS 113979]
MAGIPPRPGLQAKRLTSMRPPPRPANSRAQTATPTFGGRASPADSVVSNASRVPRSPASQYGGTKRKERDFESEGGEETSINVVVRCRGRNDREVKENSGVVVSTDGIKGKNVELSMGPSALSNKTYNFDKVFSPAADQNMIFDEVVTPILDEVMSGFNCTIFAYGQTGTGKTYTMSGDISDTLPLPDAAGIIPRALHALFAKLEGDESENSVKCSFIELYNEELRDLLSVDDNVKLKIYEDNSKKGHNATMVQGMEESHIKSASKGIRLLREGSHKRQVAATKCNDLSSRSHTVFTVTVYMKQTTDTGEDYVSAGKLNLVDLAGSENIQRSGAENKRAAEAGLINKSLLTLGRVINALVEKGSHIPYRESKLTRLLQDSLGGRTKTCIIATLSPAKSNLEETISTLDYAFRAKNIKNKPQINQMVSKKTLLKEFTAEIEKLKSELIATRQRNGVYLTAESYEEITTESESRRILSEEQRDKLETMEVNLRNKVQELFSLTSNFNGLKKDNEATKVVLEGTKSLLDKTEVVLAHTRMNLANEAMLRKAHQATEENLAHIGVDLISTLGKTTNDISGLRSKIKRKSDLQSLNRQDWQSSQLHVSTTTQAVEDRLGGFQARQDELLSSLSTRIQSFVQDELHKLEESKEILKTKSESFEKSHQEVNGQNEKSRDEMNEVLEEIKTLRGDIKEKVGAGLNDLSDAAQRISAGIVTEIDSFQTQLHTSYAALGRDFKSTFDDLLKQMTAQQQEVNDLRQQIVAANAELAATNRASQAQLVQVLGQEKEKAAEERASLLAQVTALITSNAANQEQRLDGYIDAHGQELEQASSTYATAEEGFKSGVDAWVDKSKTTITNLSKSRDTIKTRIKSDFTAATIHSASLRDTSTAVHDSTARIVADQMSHMDTQLHSLDEIVTRVRTQNDDRHNAHVASLSSLAENVQTSYTAIGAHFDSSFARIRDLDTNMNADTTAVKDTLPALDADAEIRTSLRDLRTAVQNSQLREYVATGDTPQRIRYDFPVTLPRTEPHDVLISKLRSGAAPKTADGVPRSPVKGVVFNDATGSTSAPGDGEAGSANLTRPASAGVLLSSFSTTASSPGKRGSQSQGAGNGGAGLLRELDVNVHNNPSVSSTSTSTTTNNSFTSSTSTSASTPFADVAKPMQFSSTIIGENGIGSGSENVAQPPLKRQNTTGSVGGSEGGLKESRLPMKRSTRMTVAGLGPVVENVGGRENERGGFGASVGAGVGGRRLRPRGSD